MALYELTGTAIIPLNQTRFSTQDIDERHDLQRLLKRQIDVIAPDTLVLAEELCEWDDSLRRIDLLAVDRSANLVVIELKRTEDGGHMELQAIRYAAMVSTMTFSKAVEVYAQYLTRSGSAADAESALLQFLNWGSPNEGTFGYEVRIILVSAEFSKELTTSVLWLNDHLIDIRCVRLRPYLLEHRLLLDVQQVIPLPEADAYTVQLKKKAEETRQAKTVSFDFSKYDLTVDGTTEGQLTKRGLVLKAVQAAVAKGLSPDRIANLFPNRWISVPGELTSKMFEAAASDLQAKRGGKYDLRRYFCEDDELFKFNGRTYALSNQWGIADISVVDEIISLLPPGTVSYNKAP